MTWIAPALIENRSTSTALAGPVISVPPIEQNASLQAAEEFLADFPTRRVAAQQRIFVDNRDPRFISAGEHAVVLQDKGSNFVVKMVHRTSEENGFICFGRQVLDIGAPMELMVNTLRDILHGSDIQVPDHFEKEVTRAVKTEAGPDEQLKFSFHVAPDLSVNGRYEVHEAVSFDFSSLNNGAALKREYQRACKMLCALERSSYFVSFNAHKMSSSSTPDPTLGLAKAMERVFFVLRHPLSNIGKLVAGDLDHIAVISHARLQSFILTD